MEINSELRAKAHGFTAKWEGGVCDVAGDPGGFTAYGVATHFLTDLARQDKWLPLLVGLGVKPPITNKVMKTITKKKAEIILTSVFFEGLDDLTAPLAILTYDARVNCGERQGVKFLQRAARINDLTLAIDGIIGPKTRRACQCNVARVAARAIDERDKYYDQIVEKNKTLAKFLKGWKNRTRDLRKFIADFA